MVTQKKEERSLKRLMNNILLCIVSVCIFFGGAELVARGWYEPARTHSEGHFEFDPQTIVRQKRNHAGTYFGVPYTTNSVGYRGSREYSVEKPENVRRVVVVGDSIAFGTKVLDNEPFPFLLEEALNRHFREESRTLTAEVLNAAVPGNTPFQEYYDLKRALQFNPDLIILQFTLNDVRENYGTWQLKNMGFNEEYASQEQFFDYLFGKKTLPWAFRADYLLRQHSAFYLFIRDLGNRIRFGDASGERIADIAQQMEAGFAEALVDNPQDPQIQKEWQNSLGWTRKTIRLARGENVPVLLLMAPFEFQINRPPETAHPQRIMAEFAEEEGVAYIDLLNELHKEYAASTGEQKRTSDIIADTIELHPERLQAFWSGLFYDMCHALPPGHEFIARILHPPVFEILNSEGAEEAPNS